MKNITLWKDDFALELYWEIICESLGIPASTTEIELECAVCATKGE